MNPRGPSARKEARSVVKPGGRLKVEKRRPLQRGSPGSDEKINSHIRDTNRNRHFFPPGIFGFLGLGRVERGGASKEQVVLSSM